MKNKTLANSFTNAFNGIIHSIRFEKNMKIHISVIILVIAASIILKISETECIMVALAAGGVLICELFNTAIEVLTDIIVDEVYHPKAKIVKDVAAGAVLVAAIVSVIVGYLVYFDKAISLIERLF